MHPANVEKMTFITENVKFFYNVMLFRLNNAGAAYQRLMNKVFTNQIGWNIEVYIDDMVSKTSEDIDHCSDLIEIFEQHEAQPREMRV